MSTFHGGMNTFGNVTNHGSIDIGAAAASRPEPVAAHAVRTADIGVLTILDQEIRAVQAVLQRMNDYRERRLRHGPLAREAWVPAVGGGRVRLAAVQTLTRGTDSAALACRELVQEYRPSIVLLVGIAGGVSPRVGIADVVISDEVIAYDARREAPDGVYRRGQAQAVAGILGHRLNEFFTATPARQQRADGDFRIHRGPIGSGNAVVTDAGSEIRRWLHAFNERVLAVETEAAGVAQSFQETVRPDGPRGWLTVRGISDAADRHKGHGFHDLAARHAAEVLALLAPFLLLDEA